MSVTASNIKISEAAFQAQVLQLAALKGWRTFHARPAQNSRGQWRTPVAGHGRGFPDLVLVRDDRLIFAELKTDRGRIRADQREWLLDLEATPAEVHVWRPSQWNDIAEVLS